MILGQLYPPQQWALRLLSSGKIEYIVFGGMAIRFLGGRGSDDLDIWVNRSATNLGRLRTSLALKEPTGWKVAEHLAKPKKKVTFGQGVELFSSVEDFLFPDVYSRGFDVNLDDLVVRTMGLYDLIRCKELALDDKARSKKHELDREDLDFLRGLAEQA